MNANGHLTVSNKDKEFYFLNFNSFKQKVEKQDSIV